MSGYALLASVSSEVDAFAFSTLRRAAVVGWQALAPVLDPCWVTVGVVLCSIEEVAALIESVTVAIIAVLAIGVYFLVRIRKAPYEDNKSDFDWLDDEALRGG